MNATSVSTAALNMVRGLDRNQELLGRSLSRLSSGNRILNPSDDPTGVGHAAKLESQSRRNQAASINVQNAISHVQASDGMLATMAGAVSRLSELATRALDPNLNTEERDLYQQEFSILQQQLRDTVGGSTAEIGGTNDVTDPIGRFNGRDLFGANSGLQVNLGIFAEQTLTLTPTNLRNGAFASLIAQDASGAFLLSVDDASAVTATSNALEQIGDQRATLGAAQSRLGLVAQALTVENENLGSALSRISDADVALESTQLTRYNLIAESSNSMVAQANQSPASVIRLLQS